MPKFANFALPLFALVDREKVDLNSPKLVELAEHLQGFLRQQFGLVPLDTRIELLDETPYLVLNGVDPAQLPKLLALADVQGTRLFKYVRDAAEQATLIPLAVKPH